MTTPAEHRRVGGRFATWIHRLAVPIILSWVGISVTLNMAVPQLEAVSRVRSVSMSPDTAPAIIAMKHVGVDFHEFSSFSNATIVLEGQGPLGDDTHRFYAQLVARLEADRTHVEHVQDFWGNDLTAAAAQSTDLKAVYFQVYLAGSPGEALANQSVRAVEDIVASIPPPQGVTVFVTGGSALAADLQKSGDRSVRIIELVTVSVIVTMLLLVYRSVRTVMVVLAIVGLALTSVRGVVAFLSYNELFGLSTYATQLLVAMAIAAPTDYAIFQIGRYQEARTLGQDRKSAYDTMFHGTAHVVMGSGLTIAGATLCLSLTRLPYFRTLGVPLAVGMTVAVLVALTLGPALIAVATRFSALLEPKRSMRIRLWRKIGAATVRWPRAVLATTVTISLVGLLALPGYAPSYNERNYLPRGLPANQGYAAAQRHFSVARMNPEVLLVETDHDLRNSADFLVVDKIAKAVFHISGIASVQAITRPSGKPIKFSTIPAQLSRAGILGDLNRKYAQDRADDLLAQAQDLQTTIDVTAHMASLLAQMAATTHELVAKTHNASLDYDQIRDSVADFDDFFRPIRAYFDWEPHCYDIPACWSARSLFDSIDGLGITADDFRNLLPDLDQYEILLTQMQALMPEMLLTVQRMKASLLTTHSTVSAAMAQQAAASKDLTSMGDAFNDSRNDDSFYLPPEVFDNPIFQRGIKNFISPDGRDVRFIVTHEGDPLSAEGIARIDAIKQAAAEAIKGTPLQGSRIFLGGTVSAFADLKDGKDYDLIIAGVAALSLIFIIMLIITRSAMAAAVIAGTVMFSLGTSFGLSVRAMIRTCG